MGMYEQFRTDPAVERDGVWLDYGDFMIRVARSGGANKDWQKTVERLVRPYRRAVARDALPKETADDILKEAYAESVVRDWKIKGADGEWIQGIEGPDGDALPVTKENVLATFRALPEIYADVQEQASAWVLFKATIREEQAGN